MASGHKHWVMRRDSTLNLPYPDTDPVARGPTGCAVRASFRSETFATLLRRHRPVSIPGPRRRTW